LSRELAVQFARQGVRVNALCPGPVETPLLLRIFVGESDTWRHRSLHSAIVEEARQHGLDKVPVVGSNAFNSDAVLRSAVTWAGEHPVQTILPQAPVRLTVEDVPAPELEFQMHALRQMYE